MIAGKTMTVVGDCGRQVYIIQEHTVQAAQIRCHEFGNSPNTAQFRKLDRLYDVSCTDRPVQAFARICADAALPFSGPEIADLLLVCNGGCRWEADVKRLVAAHRDRLQEHGLIVVSDMSHLARPDYPSGADTFIYSVAGEAFVGSPKQSSVGMHYIEYDWELPD